MSKSKIGQTSCHKHIHDYTWMYMVSVYGSKYPDTQGTPLIWSCLISIFHVKRTILSNCVLFFCVFWRSGLKNRQPQNLQLFGKMPYGGGPSVLRRFLILLPVQALCIKCAFAYFLTMWLIVPTSSLSLFCTYPEMCVTLWFEPSITIINLIILHQLPQQNSTHFVGNQLSLNPKEHRAFCCPSKHRRDPRCFL